MFKTWKGKLLWPTFGFLISSVGLVTYPIPMRDWFYQLGKFSMTLNLVFLIGFIMYGIWLLVWNISQAFKETY